MSELRVIEEQSGTSLGRITLTDNGSVTTDSDDARDIFDQYRKYHASDREAFDLLARGWSNGYYTVPALTTA